MHTLAVRRSFAVIALAALTATGLTVGPVAAEPVAAPPSQPGPVSRPTMAAGVIVKTTTSTTSSSLVRAAERALPDGVEVARVRKSASGARTAVLPTSRRVTAAEAEEVAAELRERSDVVWAAPNYVMTAFASPPVPATDPYFKQDKNRAIWDWRSGSSSQVKAVMGSRNTFGNGGFSSRAPYAWRATKGAGAVVAVIDTGITTHPDLPTWNGTTASGRILPGYDFVSQYQFEDGHLEDTGRDGDGWDSNPQDQGDWESSTGYCYPGSPKEPSSWHGTHVAGILAATKDNAGMVGVAPEAKILPVRVLGRCGGTTDDIIAAMKWSAGLSVTDPRTGVPVPTNSNPADVLNLSLGDSSSCKTDDALPMVEAIAAVRATGAVVVASAGNDGASLAKHPVVPATCSGVLGVGATSEYGDLAGYQNSQGKKSVYSNYGSTVDLVAPGGDLYWGNSGIVSTVNSGKTTPSGPTYARYVGTSMAAPVVSGAAALLKSVNGDISAGETERAIRGSVRPFPRRIYGSATYFKPCSTSGCGTGIIDLSKIQVPLSKPTIVGTPTIGEPLTATRGSWVRIPTKFTYEWFRDGSAIFNESGATYYPTREDVGQTISVRMRPDNEEFRSFSSTSDPTGTVPDGPDVTLTGLPPTVTYGVGATATVTVGGGGAGVIELRRGSTVLASQVTDDGSADLPIDGTKWVAGSNRIRAAFVPSGAAPAASSVGVPVTVTKASSAVTTSLRSSIRYTSRATIGITVTVPNVPKPAGQLRIYDGSKKIVYATLSSAANGKRSILLPRLAKGYHNIKVAYSGTDGISGKTSVIERIKSY
jgi:serine protease